ncbi:SRPBCC family protein [Nocardia nova]|uniref:SRPBCC family protein n=1 Tax=Nocardia nova TaxID=37330 RepID=UPI001ED9AB1B
MIEAPRHVVFDVFTDREHSGEYLPLRTRLVRPGTDSRQGVGAVHFLGFGRVGVREQIVELVADERMVYKVVAGLPVRSHIGTVEFRDAPGGTAVSYTMTSLPKLPVPRRLLVAILDRMTKTMVTGARREALARAGR